MLSSYLDYLFTAEFRDGSKIVQDRKDQSRVHPLTRSAFWDVLQRETEVMRFSLRSRDGEHLHVAHLDDGHFNTDGQIICSPYGELTNYRPIYFRRVNQVWHGGVLQAPFIVSYFVGWQANDATGKNFQMSLEIPPLGLGKSKIVNPNGRSNIR